MCDFHFSLSDALFATRLSAGLKILKVFLKFFESGNFVVILWNSLAKVRNYGKETAPERQIVSLIP